MKIGRLNVRWWHFPVAVLALFVGIPFTMGFVSGLINAIQQEEFSNEESAVREAFVAMGGSLALGEPELSSFSRELGDCGSDDGAANRVAYNLAPEGGVEDAEIVEHRYSHSWVRTYCTPDYRYYVSSVLWLPSRKGELIYAAEVNTELAKGDAEDLERLVEAQSEKYFSEARVIDATWIGLPALGDSRYGTRFTTEAKEQLTEVYLIVFTRGVAYAALMFVVPGGEVRESEVTSVAYSLDTKIQALARSVASRPVGNP